MKTLFRFFVTVFFIMVLVFLPEASWGHAFPDHSDPKVGAIVTVSPEHVRIWFDAGLESAFSTIMVHNAKGEIIDKRDGRVNPSDATLLEVSLPRLSSGAYRVIWDIAARDGHRTKGDYTFVIK